MIAKNQNDKHNKVTNSCFGKSKVVAMAKGTIAPFPFLFLFPWSNGIIESYEIINRFGISAKEGDESYI